MDKTVSSEKGITMKRYRRSVMIAILVMHCLRSPGLALTNEPAFEQFPFTFITPGARAVALGGAFIGLADDATALGINPAGLTILTDPEVSMELRQTTYSIQQNYSNPPAHENIDPVTGNLTTDVTRKTFDKSVENVPFLNVVYPYKQFVFALYRQELMHYKSWHRTSSFPIFLPATYDPVTGIITTIRPTEASLDVTVTNYGLGMALQPFERLSLAVSLQRSHLKLISHSSVFHRDVVTNFSEDDIFLKKSIDDEDVGYSINSGVLWQLHPNISIGAVYRSGPTFTVLESVDRQQYDPDLNEFTLHIPDTFGAGLAVRPTAFLTLALDVVYIRYQDLLEDFDIIVNTNVVSEENFTVDNGIEIRAGAEYILGVGKQYLALRGGLYYEPDHIIRFTGISKRGDPTDDIFHRTTHPGGQDQIHVTGGLGIVMNDRLQIDTAADIAEKLMQLSVSAIYRF